MIQMCTAWKKPHKNKNEIKVSGVSVSGEISNDMLNIFNQNENKATPFMKLFWQQ